MKKFLLAAALLAALTTAAFADGKNSNAKLLGDLKTALKSVNASEWQATADYKRTSFAANGKIVNAYVDAETNDLIGFGISIDASALPQGTIENVSKKFQGWNMINPMMFIDSYGNASYYLQVNKGGKSLAISVSSKGKVSILANMFK